MSDDETSRTERAGPEDITVIGIDAEGWKQIMEKEPGWEETFVHLAENLIDCLIQSKYKVAIVCVAGEDGRNKSIHDMMARFDKDTVEKLLGELKKPK